MLEPLNYSFRNPKKHNLSNLPHQTVEKLQKNHWVLWGPQLGKQRWRPMLGILTVKLVFQNLQSTILADDKLKKQVFVDTLWNFSLFEMLDYLQQTSISYQVRTWAHGVNVTGLRTGSSGVRSRYGKVIFPLLQFIQSGFGAHSASLLMG